MPCLFLPSSKSHYPQPRWAAPPPAEVGAEVVVEAVAGVEAEVAAVAAAPKSAASPFQLPAAQAEAESDSAALE